MVTILHKELQEAKQEKQSPLRKGYQLLIQYLMVNPENIHTSNIIQTEELIFIMYKYVYINKIDKKQTIHLKELQQLCGASWKQERKAEEIIS